MEKRENHFRPKHQKTYAHRINGLITHDTVRISGDGIESKICSLAEALLLSESLELDLVEINNKVTPPICKIVDYGKFLYEKKKKEKEINQSNKSTITKEIKLGPHIQENDLNFKSKHAINFLKEGHKIKLSMKFRGREMAFKENGEIIMLKFMQIIEDFGKPEFMPKFEGYNLYVIIKPKNK